MKRILKIMLFCIIFMNVNVYAAYHTPFVDNGESTDTDGLKAKYNSSLIKTEISEANSEVVLYGKSVCNGSSCTLTYAASNNSSFKDALAKAVTCTNGEKYIAYQFAGSVNEDCKTDNKAKLNGTAYWDEGYGVTCTNTNSGSSIVTLNTDVSTTTTSYQTASTVNNEQTGVNTYFIVLGIVAIISYVFMLCVKRFNLFKNI